MYLFFQMEKKQIFSM